MTTLLLIVTVIGFFYSFRCRWSLISSKSIKYQGVGVLIFMVFTISNIFFNWEYYKQYSGEKDIGYHIAWFLWYLLSYGTLAIFVHFLMSLIYNYKNK